MRIAAAESLTRCCGSDEQDISALQQGKVLDAAGSGRLPRGNPVVEVKSHALDQNIADKISAHKISASGDFLPGTIEPVPASDVAVQSNTKGLFTVEGMQDPHEFSRFVEDSEGYQPFTWNGESDVLCAGWCGDES